MLKLQEFLKEEMNLKASSLKKMGKLLDPNVVSLAKEFDPFLSSIVIGNGEAKLCYDGASLYAHQLGSIEDMKNNEKVCFSFKEELDLNTLHEEILTWQALDFAGAKNDSTMTKKIMKCAEEMRSAVINQDTDELLDYAAETLIELFCLVANNNVAIQELLSKKIQNINVNKTDIQQEIKDGD